MKKPTVLDICREEEAAFAKRLGERLTPLFQAEVDRLAPRYPDFKGVVCGMGSWVFRFEPERRDHAGWREWPKAFDKLAKMFEELTDEGLWSLDDIVPTPKKK